MNRVVVDIETVPLPGAATSDEQTASKASLNALSGRVACVGTILLEDDRPTRALAIVGADERHLLTRFWDLLTQHRVRGFVTHNGFGFDMPFLWRRSVINSVKPSVPLDLRKYRTDFIFDTMAIWANWESKSFVSLDNLASGLGIGNKCGSGADVAGLWDKRDFTTLAKYCMHDCWLTYALYRRMNFMPYVGEDGLETSIEVIKEASAEEQLALCNA